MCPQRERIASAKAGCWHQYFSFYLLFCCWTCRLVFLHGLSLLSYLVHTRKKCGSSVVVTCFLIASSLGQRCPISGALLISADGMCRKHWRQLLIGHFVYSRLKSAPYICPWRLPQGQEREKIFPLLRPLRRRNAKSGKGILSKHATSMI